MTPSQLDAGQRRFARDFAPASLRQAIAAHFAATDAFDLAVAHGSLTTTATFTHLEAQAETRRADLIEALQREGVSLTLAKRLVG